MSIINWGKNPPTTTVVKEKEMKATLFTPNGVFYITQSEDMLINYLSIPKLVYVTDDKKYIPVHQVLRIEIHEQ